MIEGDWNRENALSPEGRYKAYPVGIKSIFLKNNVQILIRILLTSSINTSQKKIVNENRPKSEKSFADILSTTFFEILCFKFPIYYRPKKKKKKIATIIDAYFLTKKSQ